VYSTLNSFSDVEKFTTADADDDHHASVNLVYDSKGSTSFVSVDWCAEENRTEFNCTHW